MNMEGKFSAGGIFTTEINRHSLMSRALESGDPGEIEFAKNQIKLGLAKGGYDLIETDVTHNLIPDQGLDNLLSVWINGGTQVSSRYVGIFSADSTPTNAWTSANFHAVNTTEWTAYDEVTRPLWNVGAVSGQAVTNSANKAVFTANAGAVLYGAAILSASTKDGSNDATGILYAATRYSASRPVVATDIINVQYDLSASSV